MNRSKIFLTCLCSSVLFSWASSSTDVENFHFLKGEIDSSLNRIKLYKRAGIPFDSGKVKLLQKDIEEKVKSLE